MVSRLVLSGASRGESVLCLSQLRVCSYSLLSGSVTTTSTSMVTPPRTLPTVFPSYKEPCNYTGLTWITQDNLPAQYTQFHLQSLFSHIKDHIYFPPGLGESRNGHSYRRHPTYQSIQPVQHKIKSRKFTSNYT